MSFPILSSLFFDQHPPEMGFFSKWRTLLPWTDQFMPIYEWKDVLFVGCSRPPAELPQVSQKIVYVLCEPEALKRVWYEINGTVITTTRPTKSLPTLQTPEVPDGLSLDFGFSSPPQETQVGFSSPSALQDDRSADGPESPEKRSVPEDENELLDLSAFGGNSDLLVNPLSERTSVVALKPANDEEIVFPTLKSETVVGIEALAPAAHAPEPGLDTGSILKPLMSPATSGANSAATARFSPPVVEDPEATEDIFVGPTSLTEVQETKNQNATSSPTKKPFVTIRSETVTGATSTLSIQHGSASAGRSESLSNSPPLDDTHSREEITKSAVTALTHTFSGELDEDMTQLFRQMEMKFSKIMVLLKNGDQIKPWKWNSRFKLAASDLKAYSLLPASPLRIVYRTHMPYHGYVVTNEFNQKFFKDWNDSLMPEHLTVAPILVNDHVIGMLLGISEKPEDERESLLLAEKVASELSAKIKTRPKMLSAS